AVAQLFHEAGGSVVLLDIDGDAAARVAESFDPKGQRTATLRYDAAIPEDSEDAVELCRERFGRIDCVVSAAALYENLPFLSMTDEQWRWNMAVNLDGVFYLC